MDQQQVSYNVSLKVAPERLSEWLQWMTEEHIPEVLQTGLFLNAKFYKMPPVETIEGDTYIVQYTMASINDYNRYIKEFAPALRQKTQAAFGNDVLGFRTHMFLLKTFTRGDF